MTFEISKGGPHGAALVAILLSGAILASPPAAGDEPLECRRLALNPMPQWSFSGLWTQGGKELVVVDVLGARLLRYDRNGEHVGSVVRPGQGLLDFERPVELVADGDEILLVDVGRVVGLRASLEPQWGVRLGELELDRGGRVTFLRSVVASGGQMVGLMVVRDVTDDRWWGIGRISIREPLTLERLEQLPPRDPADGLYMLLMPIVAHAGEGTYALRFENRPHLQRLLPTKARLVAFPEGFTDDPRLPENRGPATDEARFRALEMATMPVALYGRGRYLYLLTREPDGDGRTAWTLHQIDPEKDRLVRSLRLPTEANHLFLVPGPIDWALVEKGPVAGPYPSQVIGSAVLVPSQWIEDHSGSSAAASCDSITR